MTPPAGEPMRDPRRGRPDPWRADDWLDEQDGGDWLHDGDRDAGAGFERGRPVHGGHGPGDDNDPVAFRGRREHVEATRELLGERRSGAADRVGGPGRGLGGGSGGGGSRGDGPGRGLRGAGGRDGGGPRRSPHREEIYRRRRIAGLVAGAVLLVGLWFLISLFQPLRGDGEGQVRVEIPEGSSISQIGNILEREGVIASPFFFELRARLSGAADELKSGEFTLASNMSYGTALEALGQAPGRTDVTSLTIPEGLSRSEIAPVVEEAGLEGDYEQATRRAPMLDPSEYGAEDAESLEGFLFPASYELDRGATVDDLVKRQLRQFQEEFRGVDLSAAEEANLTEYDILTIASMVEREAQVASERRTIAGVIYNRLQQDIPLGIDATTRFALDNWTEPLTESDFAASGEYDTRANLGLPPGPIGNPGKQSMAAAANPEQTDYLYYVFKPGSCGEHVFTETLEEHEAAAAEYEAARAAEGGQSPEDC